MENLNESKPKVYFVGDIADLKGTVETKSSDVPWRTESGEEGWALDFLWRPDGVNLINQIPESIANTITQIIAFPRDYLMALKIDGSMNFFIYHPSDEKKVLKHFPNAGDPIKHYTVNVLEVVELIEEIENNR